VGSICTGLFAAAEWGGTNGSFYGNGIQICYQLAAIATTLAWSSTCTAVILGVLHLIFGGLRPSHDEEVSGLDSSAHGEQWEIAMTTQALMSELSNMDKKINGEKHQLNGRVSMDYSPNNDSEKSVHVEMQVPSPLGVGDAQLQLNLSRTSSDGGYQGKIIE